MRAIIIKPGAKNQKYIGNVLMDSTWKIAIAITDKTGSSKIKYFDKKNCTVQYA
jgi:hypothetical protein